MSDPNGGASEASAPCRTGGDTIPLLSPPIAYACIAIHKGTQNPIKGTRMGSCEDSGSLSSDVDVYTRVERSYKAKVADAPSRDARALMKIDESREEAMKSYWAADKAAFEGLIRQHRSVVWKAKQGKKPLPTDDFRDHLLYHCHKEAEEIQDNDKYWTPDTVWVNVTVDPKPGTSVADIMLKVNKFLKHKWIQDKYAWCIEQQSEDPNKPRGYHAHLMFYRGEGKKRPKPSKVKRDVNLAFKHLTGGHPRQLTIKSVAHTHKDEFNAFNYIVGDKPNKEKKKKQKVDRAWRKSIGLPDYWTTLKLDHFDFDSEEDASDCPEIDEEEEAYSSEEEGDLQGRKTRVPSTD